MKVSVYLRDYADPRGDGYHAIPAEEAEQLADEMRALLNQVMDQACVPIRHRDTELSTIDQDLLLAAWALLGPGERRWWKDLARRGC